MRQGNCWRQAQHEALASRIYSLPAPLQHASEEGVGHESQGLGCSHATDCRPVGLHPPRSARRATGCYSTMGVTLPLFLNVGVLNSVVVRANRTNPSTRPNIRMLPAPVFTTDIGATELLSGTGRFHRRRLFRPGMLGVLRWSVSRKFRGKRQETCSAIVRQHAGAGSNLASNAVRAVYSTGFTMCALKPASLDLRRSSSWPQPVSATRIMLWPHGCSRIFRAAS